VSVFALNNASSLTLLSYNQQIKFHMNDISGKVQQMKHFRLSLASISLLLAHGLAVADADVAPDNGAMVTAAAARKTPAIKTITNFSQALRCMDELFLGFGKQGIIITSAGIPDETGKVNMGTKEMVINAIAKMTLKSNAFEFIDFHSKNDDLAGLFAATGDADRKRPDYYIRGSISQMDSNAASNNKGIGFSLPFLDFGYSKDESFDLISMDMSIGEAATRKILPVTSTSNTMVIKKGGRSGEGGGKLGKLGLSFNIDLSRTEGLGATTRTLIELGLIESLGKFTQVPYWKCLDTDITNPVIRDQAREGFDNMKEKDQILFVQRKLGGSMNRYSGPMNGLMNDSLKNAVAEYQAQTGLIADGKVNFDLYASLLDDTQNMLAAAPTKPQAPPAYQPPAYQPPSPAATSAAPPVVMTSASAPAFSVNLQTSRGTRPSFKVGELLNLNLSLNGNGTAYCYYEDFNKTTVRLFPNRFHADSSLRAGAIMQLPNSGFKITLDQPGRERVACIGADHELLVPSSLSGVKDLTPLRVRSIDDIIGQFKQNNPMAVSSVVEISVTR